MFYISLTPVTFLRVGNIVFRSFQMEEPVRSLKVTVTRGFAETEYFIMVADGPAAYVSRDLVTVDHPPEGDSEVQGQVQVYVIDQGEHDALIELPGEPAVGGLRTRVPKSLLLSA